VEWLPRIKLAPNALDDSFLVRHRVLNALHSAICEHRLTLLSTPPGYGKSALLSLWFEAILGLANTDCALPAAYLSLDAAENDRTHFLLALIAALQTLHPACGRRAQTFLTQNGYPEPVDAVTQTHILTGLIVIDIAQYLPQRFALILDNYEQVSEPTVHGALNYLLRRLPPQAHVVVSTTQDPPLSLTKLRAHGLATILRADTLAFDEAESVAFLDKVAGLSLPNAQKIALHRYAEGWPVGLSMLAQDLHALPHEAARTHFIASLDDSDEPPELWLTVDAYLREELFDTLPRSLRMFLMQSSILSTLRVEMCQQVTGSANAAELLQELYRRNFFLLRQLPPQEESRYPSSGYGSRNSGGKSADDASYSQPHFRYNTLFAAFLRRRLYQEMADQVPRLHLLAAEASSESIQKLRHYVAAQCWSEATQLLSHMKNGNMENSEWSGELGARLTKGSKKMPAPLRKALSARSKGAPPPAAARLGITARQFEVLALLNYGASNHDIASELFITLATVKEHIGEIMRKLEVRSRHEAVRRATELGILAH
jgi:LuxR family maltose regulon positive regulatory protein